MEPTCAAPVQAMLTVPPAMPLSSKPLKPLDLCKDSHVLSSGGAAILLGWRLEVLLLETLDIGLEADPILTQSVAAARPA